MYVYVRCWSVNICTMRHVTYDIACEEIMVLF